MNVTYIELVSIAVALLFPLRFEPFAARARSASQRFAVAFALCGALVLSLGLNIALDFHAVAVSRAPINGELPFRILFDTFNDDVFSSNVAVVLGVVQSVLLFALVTTLTKCRATRDLWLLIGTTSAVMLGLALASPVMKSGDLYAYVAYAKLGLHAYHPAPGELPRALHSVAALWGNPIVASVYGPVWIAISKLSTSPFTSLATLVLALRGLEIAAFIGCCFAIRRLDLGIAAVAAFALNPGLIEQYVVDGHNDLVATAAVLAALVFERFCVVRVLCVAAAICVKLPFAFVAFTAFQNESSRLRRLVFFALAVALGTTVSVAFGGTQLLQTIFNISRSRVHDWPALIAHGFSAAVALGFALRALLERRYWPGGSLLFIGLGTLPAPWYWAWGIPYAIGARTVVPFLICAPAGMALFSLTYALTEFRFVLNFLLIVVSVGFVCVSIRRRLLRT